MLLPYERYREVLLLLKIIALATAPACAIGITNSPGHAEDLVVPNVLHTRYKDKTCLKRFIDRALYIQIAFSAFSVCIKTTFFSCSSISSCGNKDVDIFLLEEH